MTKENYDKLLKAAQKYYLGENTGLTDEQYDSLYFEAKRDIPDFNIFKLIDLGSDSIDVVHYIPFTVQEFKTQFRSISEVQEYIDDPSNAGWVITCKWDGSSIRAYYRDGNLYDILTRSDEYSGKRKIQSLIKKVPNIVDKSVIAIDFEAVCSIEDYGDEPRSNANGLVNSKYKQDEVDKYLTLIPFKVTTKDNMKYLDAMRLVFKDGDFNIIDSVNTLDYNNRFIEFKGKHYPIDGIVLYDDIITPHRIYKHYFNEVPISTVTNIAWNFTDKLCWVPKVQFEQIKIDGRNCSQASSNGYSNLKSMRAGVGAKIEIILANSTIPQVHNVIEPSDEFMEPKVCEFCGSPIINVNDLLRCSNQFCSNVINWIMWGFTGYIGESIELKSKVEISNYINSLKGKYNKDQLLEILSNSLIIPRFSKYDQLKQLILENKNKLFDGYSSLELIGQLLTWNQYYMFETYSKLVDYIIQLIKDI